MRRSSTGYRLLLRLLPRDFRERHGEEMEQVFMEIRDARSGWGRVRVRLGAAWDVVMLAIRERGRRRRARERAGDRGPEGEGRGGSFMDTFMQDLRYALRQLARKPGFTVVLVLTLALGIGANTAVFSVVQGVLLQPLPYPQPDRLTVVWSQFPTMDLMEFPSSWPEYQDFRGESRSFDEVGLWYPNRSTLTGDDNPERLDVASFTWTMWRVLGVEAARGRVFGQDEDVDGNDAVVVLSDGLWRRRFGADPSVVGGTVELDGVLRTVLGVTPSGFGFPDAETQAWIPVGIDPGNPPGRSNHFGRILGRRAQGVSLAQAESELDGLLQRWEDDESLGHSWSRELHPAFLRPLHDDVVGDMKASLLLLLGAVGFVLLIACANVANLLLVRGESRLREVSIRAAMGAGRGRIVRQLVTESLVVAVLGLASGLVLAKMGLGGLLRFAPADLPRTEAISLNGPVLLFSAAVALVAGILFGLAPAVQTLRMDVQGTLRDEGRGGTAGRRRFMSRQLLVVSQTALAVILLIGAGLFIQSFWRLRSVDPGFRTDDVLAFSVSLPAAVYPEGEDVTGFYRDLRSRVAALPGVSAVGLVRTAPLAGSLPPNDIEFEGIPRTESDGPPLNADIQVVSAGYFEALGIPLLQGRVFDTTDDATSETVAVVDEVLARRFFENPSDAIGERVAQSGTEFSRIVGIVGGVRQEGLAEEPRASLYLLHAQSPRVWFPIRGMTAVARTAVDPLSLVDAVRREVRSLDPDLPVYRVTTMATSLDASTSRERFSMFLQMAFAVVALVLAMVGIYGVLSYSVAQRTREMGIRMALGAERTSIVHLVVRQGMTMAALAVVSGVAVALAGAQVMASVLYGIDPRDPLTYLLVAGSLLAVAAGACWLPAWRASSVSPQTALRHE